MIPARWLEKVRIGEFVGWRVALRAGFENERIPGKDQTCTLASAEPDRIKLDVRSTTSEVTGCRWDAVVATWRPVHVLKKLLDACHGEMYQSYPTYLPNN